MELATRKQLTDSARFGRKQGARGSAGIAVTSHPLVTRVATDTLRSGGNAADAALAASVAQTVVEPHMTTICGVLSMLYFDAATGETTYLNGSMNRPAALTSFAASDIPTGKSVAVPGFWAAFEAAVERHGSMDKARLVAPAIELAEEGFEVYPFLYGMTFEQVGRIGRSTEGQEIFFRDRRLIDVGELLRQPRLAQTLATLVDDGNDHFYRGAFAERMVDAVQAAGGVLTRQDLEEYEVRWMEPARGTYRGYDVVGSPPPDRGGTHIVEILNLIEQIPLLEWGPPTQSADTLYWLARFCGEVYLEGFNQRDPRDFHVPLELITSKEFAAQRLERMRIGEPMAIGTAPYPGSNHVTVADKDGNVATILHSVMSHAWANGLIVDGVSLWAGAVHFLNNLPKAGGRGSCYVAPTIICKDGQPLLAAGSPSVGLIQNIVQNTVNILDFGMDIETSVHTPRFGGPSMEVPGAYYCESDIAADVRAEVGARGVQLDLVNPWNFHSGSYEGVHFVGSVAQACADPRRAGRAEAL